MFNNLKPQLLLFAIFVGAAEPVLAQSQSFDCVIDPARVVRIASPISDILEQVNVDRGDWVSADDVLALMNSDVQKTVVDINRERANSNAEILAQKARVKVVREDLKRTEQLYKKGAASKQKLDQLMAQLEVGLREQDRLVLQKKLATLELARSQIMLDERTIRSPVAGIVLERALSAGEFVNEQSYIVVIAQLDPLFVETYLPVQLYQKVVPGLVAKVKIDGAVTGEYDAAVMVVDKVFDAASETFGVRLRLDNSKYELPAGQVCKITFPIVE